MMMMMTTTTTTTMTIQASVNHATSLIKTGFKRRRPSKSETTRLRACLRAVAGERLDDDRAAVDDSDVA